MERSPRSYCSGQAMSPAQVMFYLGVEAQVELVEATGPYTPYDAKAVWLDAYRAAGGLGTGYWVEL